MKIIDNKKIIVPPGIRYISEWKDFEIFQFPYILDKQITGCGFTEYCITNSQNVVLCSPRKILLENKESQHSEEVLYVRNELDRSPGVDKDLSAKILKKDKKLDQESDIIDTIGYINNLKVEIRNWIWNCKTSGRPCKLLVTYDSFRHVRDVLEEENVLWDFQVIIDEFQSVFTDSRFKSDTELEFLNYIQDIQKLCFVSATPMMDEYLGMIDEFKDLPYYELDWGYEEPSRVIKPQLEVKMCKNIVQEATEIVAKYKAGIFDKFSYYDRLGRICEIYSKEAVFYVNSVKNICDIIKKNGLTPEETNVLCSRTIENQKRIRAAFGLGKKDEGGIGSVPKRGESHKMFTLCTRTVYLGADFYSTCAQSFIFSDANVSCLAVDITLDLPQILGRQRLQENPWKNSAFLFYKTLCPGKIMSQEDFKLEIERKIRDTNNLLSFYSPDKSPEALHALAIKYQKVAEAENYKDDYVSVNKHGGSDLEPVFNNLVMVAELRAYQIQQHDYKDRFTVISSLDESGCKTIEDIVDEAVSEFDSKSNFIDRMKLVCDVIFEEEDMKRFLSRVPMIYRNYYNIIGPEHIRALSYQKSKLELEYCRLTGNQNVTQDLDDLIYSEFIEGQRYSKAAIKDKLQDIYDLCEYKSTAKASDLSRWYELKSCTINTVEGRINGYILLKKCFI